MGFAPARRTAAHLRVGLGGPTGSGKTYTGIRLGLLLAKEFGSKFAVIDTEDKSASLYQGIEAPDGIPWEFDVCDLGKGHRAPNDYVNALADAANGYGVVLIDSLTHAWADMLAQVDKKSGDKENSFAAWRPVTPQHRALIDAILGYPGHCLFTVRSKMEYVLEKDDRGKMVPRKIGMAPVFREGLEYEATVFAELDTDHNVRIGKTRISALDGLVLHKPGPELARPMIAFLRGAPPPVDTNWAREEERFKAALVKRGHTLDDIDADRVSKGLPLCNTIGTGGRLAVVLTLGPEPTPTTPQQGD